MMPGSASPDVMTARLHAHAPLMRLGAREVLVLDILSVLIRAVPGLVRGPTDDREDTPHTRQPALVSTPIPEDDNDEDALIHDR